MRVVYFSLLLALGAWLAGCGIKSEKPLGEEIAVFDPEKVEGVWLRPGGLVGVRVLDAQRGLLVTWNVADYTKRGKEHTLQCEPPPDAERACSLKEPLGTCVWRRQADPSDKSFYYFPEMKIPDEDVFTTPFALRSDGEWIAVAYALSDDVLRLIYNAGTLPGYVDRSGSVVLGELTREHYRLILAENGGVIRWKHELPFLKVPSELDPCRKDARNN